VETQPSFVMFKPSKLYVPISRLRSTKGFPFEFGLGSKLVQELGSFVEGSKNLMTDKYTEVCRRSSWRSNASK
jgi:hypothetical protein